MKYWGRFSRKGKLLYVFTENIVVKPGNRKTQIVGDTKLGKMFITKDIPKKFCRPLRIDEIIALKLKGEWNEQIKS